MPNLVIFVGWMIAILVGCYGFIVLFNILTNRIDLTYLISESNGHASMARFQFLIFTFVIAISLFLVIINDYSFPDIPGGILALLGISGGSYVIGKGIQAGAQKPTPADSSASGGQVPPAGASGTGDKPEKPKTD